MPQSLQKAYEDTLIVDDEINKLMQLEEEKGYWTEVDLQTLYQKACMELKMAQSQLGWLIHAEEGFDQDSLTLKITHLEEAIEDTIGRAYKEEGISLTHPNRPRVGPSLVTIPEL